MFKRQDGLAFLLWFVSLCGLLAAIAVTSPAEERTDRLIRWTIWLALAYWAAAVTVMLFLPASGWTAATRNGRLARWAWTYGWATYGVHVLAAFHYYHRWSWLHALDHSREITGVAEGLYVSCLFSLVWTGDVLWWWLAPAGYARRPAWVGWAVHGFFTFLVFHSTVVFGTSTARVLGILLFAGLGAVAAWRWLIARGKFAETPGQPSGGSAAES